MFKNIIISNPEKLEKIKEALVRGGAEKIHILADFDKTITTAFVGGKSMVSFISILRDEKYLTPDYAEKAQALYDKYRPLEIDQKISIEEKKKLMLEWWTAHFDLLIKSGLNKQDIKKAAYSGKIKLREGFREFAEILRSRNIPLVIMSASGMGTEAISVYLEKEEVLFDNIHIISNVFEWDKNGYMTGVRQPIIHSQNKSETVVKDFPFYNKVRDRKNVILLGDNTEDIDMVQGFEYDNLIKIGFLNENTESNIERYKKAYDVVILNDGSMSFINELMKNFIIL